VAVVSMLFSSSGRGPVAVRNGRSSSWLPFTTGWGRPRGLHGANPWMNPSAALDDLDCDRGPVCRGAVHLAQMGLDSPGRPLPRGQGRERATGR
jgi:hypothetical protein